MLIKATVKIHGLQTPPFFDCAVRLSGLTTHDAMQRYATSLAEAYLRIWPHHIARGYRNNTFFQVSSRAPSHELRRLRDGDILMELSVGWRIANRQGYSSGFTAHVSETTQAWETVKFRKREFWTSGADEEVWSRDYLVNDIPTQAPLP
jgi:hypothetical protein